MKKWLTGIALLLSTCAQYNAEPSLLALFVPTQAAQSAPGNSTPTYTVSVSVSGVTGSAGPLVLQNNGTDNMSVLADGFHTFANPLNDGASYSVSILSQPTSPAKTCSLANATGTIAGANVTSVTALCSLTGYTLGGSISGFSSGSNLQIQETVSGQTLSIASGSTSYTFGSSVANGANYVVQITSQPTAPDFTCTLSNASGTVVGANVTNIDINCVSGKILGGSIFTPLTFGPSPQLVTIAGDAPPGAGGTGPTPGYVDATGTAARFDKPEGITTDGTNLYVLDKNNNVFRKIVIATGVVTTIATSPANPFTKIRGLTTDGSHLFVADEVNANGTDKIFQIDLATGTTTVLAGGNTGGGTNCTGTTAIPNVCKDGTGTAAAFDKLRGITTDGNNLYVVDQKNNRIRKIQIATGIVTTIAGSNGNQLNKPEGITTDGTSLFVADKNNNAIRIIPIATGSISTLFGASGVKGITTDGTNIYVIDNTGQLIKYDALTSGGTTSVLAGQAGTGFVDGLALTVGRLNGPKALTCDGNAIYIADSKNHAIRRYK